jgi:rare lipoprotein A
MTRFFLLTVLIMVVLSGCARERPALRTAPPTEKVIALPETKKGEFPKPYEVFGERYYPLPDAGGFMESGKASWYGPQFHGRKTSSGEVFDMHKKTAAHKTLPLNTLVKVTNRSSGKTIVLPVNDRGPFVKGRIIDLSYAAAREIDLVGPGTADVTVVALAKEVGTLQGKDGVTHLLEARDFQGGEFTVQVGAFEERNNALRLADKLRGLYPSVNVSAGTDGRNRTLHRVQVSIAKTLDEARLLEMRLEIAGYPDAFVVRVEKTLNS